MNSKYLADCTIGKSMILLDIIAQIGAPAKFNTILQHSPFPKPSTYRFLKTLVNQEVLSFNEHTKEYFLGNRLMVWAHTAWQLGSLATIARSHIENLSAQVNNTVHLAQLDNGQVLYLDKININLPKPIFADVGKIAPAYCTGIGKAMLAHLKGQDQKLCITRQKFLIHTKNTIKNAHDLSVELQNIQRTGVAFDREEHEEGIICIAVPILLQDGTVIGGLSVTGSRAILNFADLSTYQAPLQTTAQAIAKDAMIWMLPKMRG